MTYCDVTVHVNHLSKASDVNVIQLGTLIYTLAVEVGVSSQVVALLHLQETLYNSVINLWGAVLRYPYTGREYEINSSSKSLC